MENIEAKKYVENALYLLEKGEDHISFNFWCKEYKMELDKRAEITFSLPGIIYYVFNKWLYIVGNECLICVGKAEIKTDGIYLYDKENKLLVKVLGGDGDGCK